MIGSFYPVEHYYLSEPTNINESEIVLTVRKVMWSKFAYRSPTRLLVPNGVMRCASAETQDDGCNYVSHWLCFLPI